METGAPLRYVLRRAAEVYQRLIDRFAPQQKTNYVDLLNEWAVGFYTELDFRSEVDNLNAIRDVIVADADRVQPPAGAFAAGDAVVVEVLSLSRGHGPGRLIYPFIKPMQRRFFEAQLDLVEAACAPPAG